MLSNLTEFHREIAALHIRFSYSDEALLRLYGAFTESLPSSPGPVDVETRARVFVGRRLRSVIMKAVHHGEVSSDNRLSLVYRERALVLEIRRIGSHSERVIDLS